MASQYLIRITREVTDLQRSQDLSLAVAYKESNLRHVKGLIIGPPQTPYASGFFEFSIWFGKDYPNAPPQVKCTTTAGGTIRFNPNIYADGKVCLSILGTWRGERGEEWSPAQSLESILLSIQSLMSANPYANEPGCEHRGAEPCARAYALKVQHETLRVAVVDRLERILGLQGLQSHQGPSDTNNQSPEDSETQSVDPFADLCKRRFMWYYQFYLETIDAVTKTPGNMVTHGRPFEMAGFEAGSNGMKGFYTYPDLRKRLLRIYEALEQELFEIELAGKKALTGESPIALTFQNRYKTALRDIKRLELPVDLELTDQNPLLWHLTVFGKPMTNLDGGIISVKIYFPTDFPNEQPRAKVVTPLFHHRISPTGVLCYLAKESSEIDSHLAGIVEAIEDNDLPFDPRMVINTAASKLRWGTSEERKLYSRKLRRSVQDAAEA